MRTEKLTTRRAKSETRHLFTQITRILEINNLTTVTKEVVETTRENLVIGTPQTTLHDK